MFIAASELKKLTPIERELPTGGEVSALYQTSRPCSSSSRRMGSSSN
jgi:hypothetical protein